MKVEIKGRGIADLLSGCDGAQPSDVGVQGKLLQIPVYRICASRYQPREAFDEAMLQELSDTIKLSGVIQPVIVRAQGEGYELLAGERRWRAAVQAGLHSVPAVVREAGPLAQALVGLVENLQRSNLNCLEEARAYERMKREFELTDQSIGERIGRSRVHVANARRLLLLPETVQTMVANGVLNMGQARAILGVPEERREALALQAAKGSWSVRRVEAQAARAAHDDKTVKQGQPSAEALERKAALLARHLDTSVSLTVTRGGRLAMRVDLADLDALDRLMTRLSCEDQRFSPREKKDDKVARRTIG